MEEEQKAVEEPVKAPEVSEKNIIQEQLQQQNDIPEETSVKLNEADIAAKERVPRKKRKKSKKIKRSANYPKFYQNAYVRYCNDIRPKICEEFPQMDPVEVTKLVANKWYNLAKEEKQPYLDQAKIDKERYKKELKEFKQLNPEDDSNRSDEKSSKKKKIKIINKDIESTKSGDMDQPSTSVQAAPIPSAISALQAPTVSRKDDDVPKAFVGINCELPIFTEAFLEHNKTIESDLKLLRKNNIEIEQHNSVLMKHIENMENGVRKVDNEIAQERKKNMHLEVYLTKLRCLLASGYNSLSLPNCKDRATVENIDKYLNDLAVETTKSQNSTVSQKARDILKKMDLKSIL